MVAPAYGTSVSPTWHHGGHATDFSEGGCAACVPPHAPGCSTNQVFCQSRVEAGSHRDVAPAVQNASRAESTGTLLTDRGTGGISGDNQGSFGLWPSCLLEELAQLRCHPLPLLPPPTLHSVKGTGLILPMPCPLLGRAHGETHALGLAGMEQQEGTGPQHLAGKPRTHADPCPQVSPPPSLRPCPPQWPGLWLRPMAAGIGSLCWGWPSSGICAWVAMAAPKPRLPSGHSRSGWAGAGAVPLGLVALGSRDAVRPRAAWRLPPPHRWARVGDAFPRAGGPGDGVTPWTQLEPGESPRGDETLRRKAGSQLPRVLPGRKGWGEHGAGTIHVPLPGGPTCGHRLHECRAMSPHPVWLLHRRGRTGDCV